MAGYSYGRIQLWPDTVIAPYIPDDAALQVVGGDVDRQLLRLAGDRHTICYSVMAAGMHTDVCADMHRHACRGKHGQENGCVGAHV